MPPQPLKFQIGQGTSAPAAAQVSSATPSNISTPKPSASPYASAGYASGFQKSFGPSAPLAPQAGNYQPSMGATAKSPGSSVTPTPNTLTPSQTATNNTLSAQMAKGINPWATPSTNTGFYGSYINSQNQPQYTSVNPNTGAYGNSNSQNLSGQSQQASTGTPATAANPGNASGGFLPTPNSPTGSQNNPLGTQNPTPFNQSAAPVANNFSSYVNALGNQGNSPYNQSAENNIGLLQQTALGNAALGQNAQNIANNAGTQISKLGQLGATGGGYLTSGANPSVASGLDAQVRNTIAQQQQAVSQGANMALQGNSQALTAQGQQASGLNSAAGNALTGQGTAQSALSNAAGYAQPVANASYFGNPLTGGLAGSGTSNATFPGATGNSLIDGTIQNALNEYAAGADPVNGQGASSVNALGPVAQKAYQQALIAMNNGTYNPTTASATASTIASTNAALGSQAQTQQFGLNSALSTLAQYQPIVTNFLTQTGLNSSNSPYFNQPINNYIGSLQNPAEKQQYTAMMTDIANIGQQIIANKSPGTPTSTVEQQAANDPSLLTPSQLQSVLSTWNTLGQVQSSVLGTQSTTEYGGRSGATGTNPGTPGTITPAPNTPSGALGSITNPGGQVVAGTVGDLVNAGASLWSWIEGL